MNRPFESCLEKIASKKRTHFWIFFAILLVLACVMTYSYPIQPGHDFHFHFTRFNALIEALRDSNYPVYIDYTAANGYGYLTKVFYCDLVLVPFAIIGVFTNSIFAYQSMLFSMTILSGIFMYIAINKIYKDSYAALIGGILYAFAYYRLLDMYRRGALGETLSFTFVPIIILGLYHIIKGDYRKWYILALGFTFMIFCHVISSVLMFITAIIILIIYCKPLIKEPKRLAYLCLSGAVTLVLIAYYLYPMIEQMISGTFYYETKAVISSIGAQKEIYSIVWGLFSGIIYPVQVFVPGTGLILTIVICLRLFVYEKSNALKTADIGVLIGLFFIFASSVYFPWHIFPFNKLGFIQLPWRFYEFSTFFFAAAGGYYLSLLLKTRFRAVLGGALIVSFTAIMLVSDGKHYASVTSGMRVDMKPSIGMDYHLGMFEYMPEKLPSPWYIEMRGNVVTCGNKETQISNLKKEKGITSFDLKANANELLELPLTYYKGYTATLNGKDVSIAESDKGFVQISTDGSGQIKVIYAGTFIQKTSPLITFFALFVLLIYIFWWKRKRETK